jgi:hypothetical protein
MTEGDRGSPDRACPESASGRSADDAGGPGASRSIEPTPEPEASEPPPDRVAAYVRRRRVIGAVLGGASVVAILVIIVIGRGRSGDVASDIAAPDDAARAAVRAPETPQLPAAPDGVRLSGLVVDGANAPVAGVEVSAELEQTAIDAGAFAGAPRPDDAGVDRPAITVTPPTAEDGRFVLAPLAPGRYRVRVSGPGILAAEVRYVPVPSDEARIVVARQVIVEGTVVDDGVPVANARVGLRGEAIGGALEIASDGKGQFRFPELPEGRYQLYAWRDTLAARAIRINRLGAGPFPPVELTLEAATVVVGRVIDRDEGTGIVAAIELRPAGDDQAPRYARSGADGAFRVEGVPRGRWIVDAFSPGYTSPAGLEIEAGRGIPELALARGATIEGRVVDAAGEPIANASVRAIGGAGGGGTIEQSADVDRDRLRRFSGRMATLPGPPAIGTASDPVLLPRGELGVMVGPIPPIPPPGTQIARPAAIDPATVGSFVGEPAPLPVEPARASIWLTGPDGRFRIRGLPRGKFAVLAAATGHAEGSSREVAVELGQMITDVTVVLTPGTFLVGRVTDQHGVRVIGAQIRARPRLGAPLDAYSDDEGSYRLGPVTGTVELVASAYGHAELRRTLELAPSKLRDNAPAERREDLVLVVADAVLAGTLDDATGAPVPGALVEILSGGGEGRQAVVGRDGTFSIDMLAAGRLRVRVSHPDYPTVELEAQASPHGREKVRLRLPLGGAIEGALLDDHSGAPLPGVIVSGSGPGGATADITSDPAGRWKLGPLRPGRWQLAIEHAGYLPVTRELEVPPARVPGATSVRDVRIDLARGAIVGGTVRDARGNRVPGAMIRVEVNGVATTGTTNAEGEFRIRDVPTGEVTITASRGDAIGITRVTLRPGGEVLGLALEVR